MQSARTADVNVEKNHALAYHDTGIQTIILSDPKFFCQHFIKFTC